MEEDEGWLDPEVGSAPTGAPAMIDVSSLSSNVVAAETMRLGSI